MLSAAQVYPLIVTGALFSWLGACVVYDLRIRQVPNWLTVLPLVAAGLWRVLDGDWPIVGLVVGLILISDIPNRLWMISIALTMFTLFLPHASGPDSINALPAIFAAWAMWEVGALGGADAKMLITLVLLFGNGAMLRPVFLFGGFQGLLALFRGERTIPFTLSIALGTCFWWLFWR